MIGDGDAEVGDRHQDGQAELAHQQTYQARLKKHGNAYQCYQFEERWDKLPERRRLKRKRGKQ